MFGVSANYIIILSKPFTVNNNHYFFTQLSLKSINIRTNGTDIYAFYKKEERKENNYLSSLQVYYSILVSENPAFDVQIFSH